MTASSGLVNRFPCKESLTLPSKSHRKGPDRPLGPKGDQANKSFFLSYSPCFLAAGGIVVMQEETPEPRVWSLFSRFLRNFGQAQNNVPLSHHYYSLLFSPLIELSSQLTLTLLTIDNRESGNRLISQTFFHSSRWRGCRPNGTLKPYVVLLFPGLREKSMTPVTSVDVKA